MNRLISLGDSAKPRDLGGKGEGIAWLLRHGFRAPRTWVVSGTSDGGLDLSGLDLELRYAVRSSADVEDGDRASFAGQFLTVLDASGADEIVEAERAVRASAQSPGATAYAAQQGVAGTPRMHTLIQEMVTPVASGVVFTRNPITGLNESVLEAVSGRGDRLVQEGVTPQRWVRRWGAWVLEPDDPVIADELAESIVDEAQRIASEYDRAADLEWVWDGEAVWWVQVRAITAIDDVGIYSNRISKEVMPGLIKPLVWSVNVPVVNTAWIKLFREAAGKLDLEPDDLARQFAYRSYFNMAAIGEIFEALGMPRDSLESLLGLPEGPDQPRFKPSAATMAKLPRLMMLAARRSRFGSRIDRVVEPLRDEYEPFDRDPAGLSDTEVFSAIRELMEIGTRAAYANIVIPLLANLYSALLRGRLAKWDVDVAEVDLGADTTDVDPNHHLDRLGDTIEEHGADSEQARAAAEAFLARFGHLSDSGNDFSVPQWGEDSELPLRMATGRNSAAAPSEQMPWSSAEQAVGARSRGLVRILRRRAVRYQEGRGAHQLPLHMGVRTLPSVLPRVGRSAGDAGSAARA